MGEIAEMMLDGTMDFETGEWNFDGADGPGFPMTTSQAKAYRLGQRDFLERRKFWGDWMTVAQFARDGERAGVPATRANLRKAMGWSRKKAGGIIAAMTDAGFLRCKADTFGLTVKGENTLEAS